MEARQNTLTITGLRTEFLTPEGPLAAVDGVDLAIPRGSIVGLVGESGCGKSVTALSVLGLVPPAGRVAAGEIRFGETDLRTLGEGALRKLRGNRIAMIFQDPMTSLNPVYPVGRQVAEVLRLHRRLDRWAAKARTVELFQQVGIPDPAARYDAYPRQLSGGLRQRVMIAMAMACEPELLIADEPTTALDVTIQAQILRLMGDLRRDHGTAILLITHNMGVVAQLCDYVYVMYAGQIVEAVISVLERTPPELSADILDRGIVLTGGGAMLRGLEELIEERTGINTMTAEEPMKVVAIGTGQFVEFMGGRKER